MITVITTVLVALITAIIGPIVVSWARLKMDKKPKINPMQEAIEFNSLVDEQLQILLEELECDRVWIAQFHK